MTQEAAPLDAPRDRIDAAGCRRLGKLPLVVRSPAVSVTRRGETARVRRTGHELDEVGSIGDGSLPRGGIPRVAELPERVAAPTGGAAARRAESPARVLRPGRYRNERGLQDPDRDVRAQIRLALARGELPHIDRSIVVQSKHNLTFGLMWIAARLDGLAALGERTRIEDEAPRFLKPRTYLEPFALRALGIVRQDPALIDQALERFAALGLAWHAAQTGALAQGV